MMTIFLMSGIWSCGSRKVEKKESEERVQVAHGSEVERQETEVTGINRETVKQSEATTQTEAQAKREQSESELQQSKYTNRVRTYYPNGQLKSERDMSREDNKRIDKLTLEVEYWRLSAHSWKEQYEELKETTKVETKQEKREQDTFVVEQSETGKKTAREAYPWYWWVIGGIIVWEFLKFFARNYFPKIRSN